ncbi:hypothetical protein B566_EDAN006201 [Ephemera danica]|nr:hypothetical protein B566_EDAN006201 [Ephemera danica]
MKSLEVLTPEILSNEEMREFSVSWNSEGFLTLANKDEDALIEIQNAKFTKIKFVGIRTASGIKGTWNIFADNRASVSNNMRTSNLISKMTPQMANKDLTTRTTEIGTVSALAIKTMEEVAVATTKIWTPYFNLTELNGRKYYFSDTGYDKTKKENTGGQVTIGLLNLRIGVLENLITYLI